MKTLTYLILAGFLASCAHQTKKDCGGEKCAMKKECCCKDKCDMKKKDSKKEETKA